MYKTSGNKWKSVMIKGVSEDASELLNNLWGNINKDVKVKLDINKGEESPADELDDAGYIILSKNGLTATITKKGLKLFD